jgi:transposase
LSIITRKERERLVLELYNQGKTIREIAKEVRMSFRDIGVILNKAVEKKDEALKEQGHDNNGAQYNQQEQHHLSLAAQAYKLFSDRKTPLEVAIALNLAESEATKFYRQYWKLRQLHNLNMVYEEIKGDIEPLLRLYRLSKAKGMGPKQVVNLLAMANEDLPAIEEQIKRLRNEISALQFQKRIDERNLYQLNNKIASTIRLLNSFRMSCKRERREIEKLYNEKARLEALVTGFKNDNEEYLNKIKQAAYEEVKSVLSDSKLLLKFATFLVIESLRRNSELYNFIIHDNSNNNTISYGSNYPSLVSEQRQQSFNDICTALVLEEAENLYNKLRTELTNRVIAAGLKGS